MTSSKKINNKIIDLVFEVTQGLSRKSSVKMFQIFKYLTITVRMIFFIEE